MSDEAFIAQLEAGTLPRISSITPTICMQPGCTLPGFRGGSPREVLQSPARLRGVSGKADRYHETITWAYLLLLNERIRRSDPIVTWNNLPPRTPTCSIGRTRSC